MYGSSRSQDVVVRFFQGGNNRRSSNNRRKFLLHASSFEYRRNFFSRAGIDNSIPSIDSDKSLAQSLVKFRIVSSANVTSAITSNALKYSIGRSRSGRLWLSRKVLSRDGYPNRAGSSLFGLFCSVRVCSACSKRFLPNWEYIKKSHRAEQESRDA